MPRKRNTGKSRSRSSKTASKNGKRKSVSKASSPAVLVVNMIPKSLSGETNQDSEPTIAVNPANPLQIAASAFTPDPLKGSFAPIYVSNDGGNTWTLNSIVPGNNRRTGTGDITLQFSKSNSTLYAGILRGDSRTTRMNILRTKNFAGATPMEILVDRKDVDQPYVQVASVSSGADKGKDRVYVGNNDLGAGRSSDTIDQSLNGSGANPDFQYIPVEPRSTARHDGPPGPRSMQHD